jgi:Short C-terminal domain
MLRRRPIARMAVRTTAVVGTAAVVGSHVANKQAAAAQQQQAAAEPEYAPAPAPAPAAPAPDPIAQLTQLAALRDSGALTEAEFEAQKAKILG